MVLWTKESKCNLGKNPNHGKRKLSVQLIEVDVFWLCHLSWKFLLIEMLTSETNSGVANLDLSICKIIG